MPVIYNNFKIVPGPFCSIQKVYNTTGDGKRISSSFSINLTGKIVVDKGSPNSAGTFWGDAGYPPDEIIEVDAWLTTMIRKQEALRDLFSNEGKTLEIQGYDGQAPLKCNPVFKSIEFQKGNLVSWTNICDYTIVLEASIIYVNGLTLGEDDDDTIANYHIDRFNETFNIEATDEYQRTWRLTRQISAKGKRFFDETGTLTQEAWENARDYVLNKEQLGIDLSKMVATGVLNQSSLQAYNYLRNQSVNETDGEFSCTETWLCYDPGPSGYAAIEEFNINTKIQDNGFVNVTVDGNIKGLEVRDNTTRTLISNRYDNAVLKFSGEIEPALASRAQNISGYTLNVIPVGKTIGRNPNNGLISYNYEYNNRPSSTISGAISEIITVGFENSCDVFASIPILGRAAGPILQNIGTTTLRKKTLNIEAVMPASTQTYTATSPNTDALVTTFAPSADQVFRERDSENFTYPFSKYTRQVTFAYGN